MLFVNDNGGNYSNQQLRVTVCKAMNKWLDMGLSNSKDSVT